MANSGLPSAAAHQPSASSSSGNNPQQTAASSSTTTVTTQEPPVLHLRLRPRTVVNVTWDEDVIDNEGMGKKSSKKC
ncbi:unnamed protein product [Amoebophrya sp. A120]|nr:unnamed protein product [Amoebophrya sp. A120]|eukprot:GSA120T00024093001.1